MKLTHYAIRDLHAIAPDDEQPGVHDVIAKAEDGHIFYTEDVYDSKEEAEADLPLLKTYEFDYWSDKPVGAEHVGEVSWVAA
jgi:hypothetical protein